MESKTFRAYRVFEPEPNRFERRIVERPLKDLPDHEVLVQVHYSALNYKDALSATGNRAITKSYPHTPGIDSAGVIVQDQSDTFDEGEDVLVAGHDLGMNTDGGFGEYIRVPASWCMPLPKGLNMRESMMVGATGFTAGLSVYKLIRGGQMPGQGPVLVTGAAGGVGSIAVLILKKLGFEVIAATSSIEDSRDFISLLQADRHVDKSVTDDQSGKALRKPQWAGAIDVVGGNVLATILKSCNYGGNVTACGNIFSPDLNTTVYPFILNAVNLLGVDAQRCPEETRRFVWEKLATDWKIDASAITQEITLEELDNAMNRLINKKNRGQVVLCHEHSA